MARVCVLFKSTNPDFGTFQICHNFPPGVTPADIFQYAFDQFSAYQSSGYGTSSNEPVGEIDDYDIDIQPEL